MNTITFDDNIVVMKLKDYKNATSSCNHYYKCWREKEEQNKILQSKIDKAIELGDKIIEEYENIVGLTGNLVLNFKQVLNILKENK